MSTERTVVGDEDKTCIDSNGNERRGVKRLAATSLGTNPPMKRRALGLPLASVVNGSDLPNIPLPALILRADDGALSDARKVHMLELKIHCGRKRERSQEETNVIQLHFKQRKMNHHRCLLAGSVKCECIFCWSS